MLAQRLALDELGGDEMDGADLTDLVDGDNVRVIERRGRARFPLKAAHPIRVGDELFREQFERDSPARAPPTMIPPPGAVPHPLRKLRQGMRRAGRRRAQGRRNTGSRSVAIAQASSLLPWPS